MRKINKQDVFRLVLILALVAGIGFAMGAIGRFVPTHKIVQPVYCGSCHPEQVEELEETTHLGDFTKNIENALENYANESQLESNEEEVTPARIISGGCQMCHNYWDNFKWWGMKNFTVDVVEEDVPSLGMIQSENDPKDIYGNAVSPYGLGSTKSYMMTVVGKNYLSGIYPDDPTGPFAGENKSSWNEVLVPWAAGFDVYQYTYDNNTYSRLDYVWSKLSSLSPGPVGYRILNQSNLSQELSGCGTAEKGLCHAAADAVALSSAGWKREFPEWPNTATGGNGSVSGINPADMKTLRGAGTFFQHEMAFTTAQYAAKPVKICGACHVFKLPPMRWGGEPWAVKDVWDFSRKDTLSALERDAIVNGTDQFNGVGYGLDEPFGFRPTYNDLTGDAKVTTHVKSGKPTQVFDKEFNVRFRTPDWAHANVPCIRCHVHAGINNKLVASEEDIRYEGPAPAYTPPSPGSLPENQAYSGYSGGSD